MCTRPIRLPANRIAVSVVPMPSSSGSLATSSAIAPLPAQRGLAQLAEQVVAGLVVVERRQRGDDDLAGHLAGGVATHAVGEREQARARVHGVLVVRTDQAPVAAGRVAKDEGHERSSITVLPIRIGAPSGTRRGAVTLARSRYVPFVEPRSSTYQSVPRNEIRACLVDA